MKTPEMLCNEAEKEVENEKEQTMKEIIKEHLLRIQETKAAIADAEEMHEKAKKEYHELFKDKNVLLKKCLQRISSQPIKPKD